MFFADLVFASREWLWPAVGLLLAGVGLVIWNYAKSNLPHSQRIAIASLKTLGFTALALCLLEPLWSSSRARPGANVFAILADNSQGMNVRDRNASDTRAEELKQIFTRQESQTEWQNQLGADFQLRRYVFDSRLQFTRDFAELTFDGRASGIGTALRSLSERYRGRPLAGVLLFTDGNATDMPNGAANLAGLPPVYPVVIGRGEPARDIGIQSVTTSQTSFEDGPITIQAIVGINGYSQTPVIGQLFDLAGKKLAEQQETARSDSATVTFRFQIRPEASGISFYQFRVAARSELGQFENPSDLSEATLANNRRLVVVDRGRGPHRILYVSGRPNWEFKFLNRAISEDDEVQLVALIRIAKREPKFEFRGRSGESNNPLFRGFDKTTEETERYDEPVLIGLNTRDEAELRGGFPKTAEELFGYEAVILDDLEAEFFTRDQMTLLQRFVSERGGGFLMLGGQESFQQGNYERTPIADVLPVYLDRAPTISSPSEWRFDLTREGWLQPWARLRNTESEERSRLQNMPSFQVLNGLRDIKPGASLLATVSDATGRKFPALVGHRYGNGRSVALMVGDMWRWGFRDEPFQQEMAKSWRQLIRWLIADVPHRFDLQVEPAPGSTESMHLQLRVRDKSFEPIENASAVLRVQTLTAHLPVASSPDNANTSTNQSIRIRTEPSSAEPGLYTASFVARETGAFKAEAVIMDESGLEIGKAEAGWTADPAAEEFRSLAPNRALLEQIARETGGEVIEASSLAKFARSLPSRPAPITETWSFPLWHTPAMFLFALACFAAEWGFRRWKGLA